MIEAFSAIALLIAGVITKNADYFIGAGLFALAVNVHASK